MARKTARVAPKSRSRKAPAKKAPRVPDGLGYVNGKVLDLAKATIPLNDRGYLLGDGVFETLRTVNGKVFRLDDHAARLRVALRRLSVEQQRAVVLAGLLGFSAREVAELEQIPLGTAKTRVRTALLRLRAALLREERAE